MNVELTFAASLVVIALVACAEQTPNLASADYTNKTHDASCGEHRRDNSYHREKAPRSLDFILRAPQNFDPLVRHPLLVVFPPAGHTSLRSEIFSNFTAAATARGFIVLYPGHQRLSARQIDRLGALVTEVSESWCIDQKQVFFTGHSDGGTVAHVLAQRTTQSSEDTQPLQKDATIDNGGLIRPAKIAPSAAGVTEEDLTAIGCRHQIPIMVMHGAADALFPAYGQSARNWWLACNECDKKATPTINGCKHYKQCAERTEVIYCESAGGHRQWEQSREQILDFFLRSNDPSGGSSAAIVDGVEDNRVDGLE